MLFVAVVSAATAQNNIYSSGSAINYLSPKEYEIGGVTISCVQYLDHNVLLYLTGLEIGKKISVPGQEIADAIKKLWEQGLFSDVKISVTNTIGDKIFLDIYLEERPRRRSRRHSRADKADKGFTGYRKHETLCRKVYQGLFH